MTDQPKPSQTLSGEKKIQVFIKCQGCKKEINRTTDLPSMEIAEKIYFDALLNPMIGWCNDCDRKPFPFIEVNGKIIKKVKDTK